MLRIAQGALFQVAALGLFGQCLFARRFGCLGRPLALLGGELGDRTAGRIGQLIIDLRRAQEAEYLAVGNGKAIFGIIAVGQRAEAVHPDGATAHVDQRAAAIALGQRSGVQDRVEIPSGPAARNHSWCLDRGHGGDGFARIEPLRAVDRSRVTDRHYRSAIVERRLQQGEGRQATAFQLDQREVVARR